MGSFLNVFLDYFKAIINWIPCLGKCAPYNLTHQSYYNHFTGRPEASGEKITLLWATSSSGRIHNFSFGLKCFAKLDFIYSNYAFLNMDLKTEHRLSDSSLV